MPSDNNLYLNRREELVEKPKDRIDQDRISVYGILIENGKILLAKEKDSELWDLPGGGQEQGEDDFQTLKREMMEEVGCEISELGKKLGETLSKFYADDIDEYYRNTGKYYFVNKFKFLNKLSEHEIEEYKMVDLNDLDLNTLHLNHAQMIRKFIK